MGEYGREAEDTKWPDTDQRTRVGYDKGRLSTEVCREERSEKHLEIDRSLKQLKRMLDKLEVFVDNLSGSRGIDEDKNPNINKESVPSFVEILDTTAERVNYSSERVSILVNRLSDLIY